LAGSSFGGGTGGTGSQAGFAGVVESGRGRAWLSGKTSFLWERTASRGWMRSVLSRGGGGRNSTPVMIGRVGVVVPLRSVVEPVVGSTEGSSVLVAG
jgi:hypothetical protein